MRKMATTALRATVVVLSLCSAASAQTTSAQSASALDDRRDGHADRQRSEVASAWFDELYQIVRAEGTAPPPASRIYGVVSVALYEAVVRGRTATARWSGS